MSRRYLLGTTTTTSGKRKEDDATTIVGFARFSAPGLAVMTASSGDYSVATSEQDRNRHHGRDGDPCKGPRNERLGRTERVAEAVGGKGVEGGPQDSSRGVIHEEFSPRHPSGTTQKGRVGAKNGDEPAEEDGHRRLGRARSRRCRPRWPRPRRRRRESKPRGDGSDRRREPRPPGSSHRVAVRQDFRPRPRARQRSSRTSQ